MDKEDIFEGKYKILKILGKGGMSTVYLAENIKLGTLWAIKEINKKPDSKIDLFVEPNILKKLNHPALPRIFDIVEDEASLYVIVDFIEGESLDKGLAREGKFPEETVMEWARQLCEVLDYLHNFKPNPIIYRDMKPANIILTADGIIKLIDFGIAREYKSESGNDTVYIGTRGYAAPEQYGFGQTDVTTDIYNLGMTLSHLITGIGPHVASQGAIPDGRKNARTAHNTMRIIEKCIKQNPKERYQTISELLNEIESLEYFKSRNYRNKPQYRDRSLDYSVYTRNNCSGLETNSRMISFKRTVLSILGNAEFACEFAYFASKLTEFRVLLMELDFITPKLEFYFNLSISETINEFENTFESILKLAEANKPDEEKLFEACSGIKEVPNLQIVVNRFEAGNYDRFDSAQIEKLIDLAYRKFDITILSVNRSVLDKFTIKALEKSDFYLVPLAASADNLREFEYCTQYFYRKHGIHISNSRFVAYEYKPGLNPPLDDFKSILGSNIYLGCISYNEKREIHRNLKTSFANRVGEKGIDEYINILARFDILPKTTLNDKLLNLFNRLNRRIKKSAGIPVK
jgi:serine/threonine protein kinase